MPDSRGASGAPLHGEGTLAARVISPLIGSMRTVLYCPSSLALLLEIVGVAASADRLMEHNKTNASVDLLMEINTSNASVDLLKVASNPIACVDCRNWYCGVAYQKGSAVCQACCEQHKRDFGYHCGEDCFSKAEHWCKGAPTPAPGPVQPLWPTFATMSALQQSSWSKYFSSLYGELPTSYPLKLSSFWCFYLDKMQAAGATPPNSVGQCPTSLNAPDGQRYDQNNAYSSTDLTWLWHPVDSPPYEGFLSDTIVEVTHHKDPFGDEHEGMWFLYAKGSGIFLHIGSTKVFNRHADAETFFGAKGNEDMCQKAAAQGYDTIQFIRHVDGINYPCANRIGAPWMNMEIVAVNLIGTYACGQAQGTAPALRAGWNGDKPCKCDPTNPNTNCVFSNEGAAE